MTSHRYPESAVFYRKLRREYPRIVRADGCYLYDDQGRRYLDGCGGAYVVNVGHGVSEIAEALACQAAKVAYVSGTVFTHDAVEEFAAELARVSPGDLDLVYPAGQRLGSGRGRTEAGPPVLGGVGARRQAQDPRVHALLSREHAARAVGLVQRIQSRALSRVAGGGGTGPGAVPVSLRLRG